MRARTSLRDAPRATPALSDSLTRINQRQELVTIELGAGTPEPSRRPMRRQDRHHCAGILAEGLAGWHAITARWLQQEYGEAPERTVAAHVRSWYLNVPALAGALLFHHDRRVPWLRPADLSFRLAADGKPAPETITLHSAAFACLPDDPAAGDPAATVVDCEHRLAALLRARYAAHGAEFVRTYRPAVRFGSRNLWGAVTDALDISMWRAGKHAGDEAAGVADAALLLPEKSAPFTSASTLRQASGSNSHTEWTRRKESCCFHYLLADGKGECATCPRVVPPRRE
ncbi:(2Fe-2S)-binding protein [Haloechinothrix sp. LS1_15]|uniref:(2Fe-2S)-binding protein n=1 Tax=Haloechinothrix sp. LS1_15 TaxID=2652248 RepID=UPI002945C805|nr:(2Fe-2S)-binding protein [Haloechinothrix sp. LS1_15]MDV6011434.1 (2Fe-2S)-binding protein [Haloechinothrix sp. LS1_15]